MAQVVNLSDQDRSIQLDDFTQSVFAIVFSYLHSPAILEPRARQGDKRVTDLHGAALEQAETLVIAESVMRQKFVAQDAFTRLPLGVERVADLRRLVASSHVDSDAMYRARHRQTRDHLFEVVARFG